MAPGPDSPHPCLRALQLPKIEQSLNKYVWNKLSGQQRAKIRQKL